MRLPLNSALMHVRFSDAARANIRKIRDYLSPLDAVGAKRAIDFILTTAFPLESFPLLGRTGRVEGTCEIVIPRHPYFIVYTFADDYHIDIEAVFHTRRQYPPED
jgi:toxin ParE1/3/4